MVLVVVVSRLCSVRCPGRPVLSCRRRWSQVAAWCQLISRWTTAAPRTVRAFTTASASTRPQHSGVAAASCSPRCVALVASCVNSAAGPPLCECDRTDYDGMTCSIGWSTKIYNHRVSWTVDLLTSRSLHACKSKSKSRPYRRFIWRLIMISLKRSGWHEFIYLFYLFNVEI